MVQFRCMPRSASAARASLCSGGMRSTSRLSNRPICPCSPDLLVILNDNDMSISRNEGGLASYLARNLKQKMDGPVTAALFKALEFNYSGPVDGHDFSLLLPAL